MHRAIVEFIQRASRIAKRPATPDNGDTGEETLPAEWMGRLLSYSVPSHSRSDTGNAHAPPMKMILLWADRMREIRNLYAFCSCCPEQEPMLPTVRLSLEADRRPDEHNILSPVTIIEAGLLYNVEDQEDPNWYNALLKHLDLPQPPPSDQQPDAIENWPMEYEDEQALADRIQVLLCEMYRRFPAPISPASQRRPVPNSLPRTTPFAYGAQGRALPGEKCDKCVLNNKPCRDKWQHCRKRGHQTGLPDAKDKNYKNAFRTINNCELCLRPALPKRQKPGPTPSATVVSLPPPFAAPAVGQYAPGLIPPFPPKFVTPPPPLMWDPKTQAPGKFKRA